MEWNKKATGETENAMKEERLWKKLF